MFHKLKSTRYPPKKKPILVWDGNCGFCKYWVTRWQSFTGDKIFYEPYQEVARYMPDIDEIHFKQASRLIETDGQIFSGPASAYRTFTYGSKWAFLFRWYSKYKWFQKLSDSLYNWVARNRSSLFKITKFLFGSNPEEVKPFWVIYLLFIAYIIYIL